jgi:DNA-binding ferritin-like protein (Dps family)
MDNIVQIGNFPSKPEWKKLVNASIQNVERESWKMKVQRYDQLRLYNQVIKELVKNMWLHFGMENSEIAERVSKIIKILCGSFFVNGARLVGENNQFFCDTCGKNFVNPVKHALLYCCKTQSVRTNFWDKLRIVFL